MGFGFVSGPGVIGLGYAAGLGLSTRAPLPPVVTSISPTHGTADGGTEITISGSHFATVTTVHFSASSSPDGEGTDVAQLVEQGLQTGASRRNWDAYGAEVLLDPALTPAARAILTDPQTSGGLLVSCTPQVAPEVLRLFAEQGFEHAAVVGEMLPPGSHTLVVRA